MIMLFYCSSWPRTGFRFKNLIISTRNMSYNISNETPASPTSPGSKPQFRFIVDRVEGDPVTPSGGSTQAAPPNGSAVHAGKEPSPPPSYSRYHVTDDYEQMTARFELPRITLACVNLQQHCFKIFTLHNWAFRYLIWARLYGLVTRYGHRLVRARFQFVISNLHIVAWLRASTHASLFTCKAKKVRRFRLC